MGSCNACDTSQRISIFSVYDKNGVWGAYRSYILKELKEISDKVFIVVNGFISDDVENSICDCNTRIIIRENKGFDAGAYKDVIMNHIGMQGLRNYQELILCNDTFFGPFVSFSKIFSDMKQSDSDFWGLYRIEHRVLQIICSCFYVFRLKDNLLYDVYSYFDHFINADNNSLFDVYMEFENGLYSWLISQKYKSDVYIKEYYYSFYENGDMNLLQPNFPIFKKKFFLFCKNKENVIHSLQIIHNTTRYSIDMILEFVDLSTYGIHSVKDILRYPLHYEKLNTSRSIKCKITREQMLSYISAADEIYIYGAGVWGCFIYDIYFKKQNKCKGFIVSIRSNKKEQRKLPIYEYENNFASKNVIVAMSYKNTEDLIKQMGRKVNWLYLW